MIASSISQHSLSGARDAQYLHERFAFPVLVTVDCGRLLSPETDWLVDLAAFLTAYGRTYYVVQVDTAGHNKSS
jgi:hypothetical protein